MYKVFCKRGTPEKNRCTSIILIACVCIQDPTLTLYRCEDKLPGNWSRMFRFLYSAAGKGLIRVSDTGTEKCLGGRVIRGNIFEPSF